MGYKVAVVGATGNVGRAMLEILAERNFPADEVVALASARSAGREVSFGDDDVLTVQNLETFDFTGTDVALSVGRKDRLHHLVDVPAIDAQQASRVTGHRGPNPGARLLYRTHVIACGIWQTNVPPRLSTQIGALRISGPPRSSAAREREEHEGALRGTARRAGRSEATSENPSCTNARHQH